MLRRPSPWPDAPWRARAPPPRRACAPRARGICGWVVLEGSRGVRAKMPFGIPIRATSGAAPSGAPPSTPRRRPRLAHGSCSAPSAPRQPARAAHSTAERGAARLWLVLDMRRRMGEGRASGGPWGEGLGKGDLGRLEGSKIARSLSKCAILCISTLRTISNVYRWMSKPDARACWLSFHLPV